MVLPLLTTNFAVYSFFLLLTLVVSYGSTTSYNQFCGLFFLPFSYFGRQLWFYHFLQPNLPSILSSFFLLWSSIRLSTSSRPNCRKPNQAKGRWSWQKKRPRCVPGAPRCALGEAEAFEVETASRHKHKGHVPLAFYVFQVKGYLPVVF